LEKHFKDSLAAKNEMKTTIKELTAKLEETIKLNVNLIFISH
jgi:hypothetical protein